MLLTHSLRATDHVFVVYSVDESGFRPESEFALLAKEVIVDPAAVKVVPAEHPVLVSQSVPLLKRELGVSAHVLMNPVMNSQLDGLGGRVVPVLTVSLILN